MKMTRMLAATPIRLLKDRRPVHTLKRGESFQLDLHKKTITLSHYTTLTCSNVAIEQLIRLSSYALDPARAPTGDILPPLSVNTRGDPGILPPRMPPASYEPLLNNVKGVENLLLKVFVKMKPARYNTSLHRGVQFEFPLALGTVTVPVQAYVFVLKNRPSLHLMFVAHDSRLIDKIPKSKTAQMIYSLFGSVMRSIARKYNYTPYPVVIQRAYAHTATLSGNLVSYSITF